MSCLDENTVLTFLEGRLPPARVTAVEEHLQTCEACRDLVALSAPAVASVIAQPGQAPAVAAAPTPVGGLSRGATVGRYVILAPVGVGAMGEVYAAFDPELNRKVALKLLRSRSETAEGRARLLREAQSIAKLQHPSVVVVHDAGTIGDRVFIAMEFVEGATMRGWLGDSPRSRREILDVYLAAGRGLAAAHARGLVHRDFKPDNVMVTDEGQVRVMDFGLARQLEEGATAPGTPAELELLDAGAQDATSLKLTQTGAVVGTPAYMAPEQFTMGNVEARTDQFSFCVALYEALYGERPFAGATFGALMKNVVTGSVSPPPPKSRVPGWLRRVLLRGLSTDPALRYPSMSALLTALDTDPTVRSRRLAMGAALVVCIVAGIALARRGVGAQRASCQSGGARWAGVWEDGGAASDRKEQIRRAFLATGKPYAGSAFLGVSRSLDDYVARWSQQYRDACEATNVRGEQSEQVLDLRMSCLQERLTAARALTDVFVSADGTAVENAVSAAIALPPLDRCSDLVALRAVIKPPDAAARVRVEALSLEKARLIALHDAGHCGDAERLAQALLPKVRALGYRPLVAETLTAAALLAEDCVPVDTGIERYREAYVAAVVSHHDEVAAEAAILVAQAFSDRKAQPLPGRQWQTVATAAVERAGSPPRLQAWLLNSEVYLLQTEHRADEAVEVARTAVATAEQRLGRDSLEAASAYNSLGLSLSYAKRYEESLRALANGSERWTKLLGAQHPRLAISANNAGESLNALHRYAEARASFQRALDIWRGSGSHAQFIAYALTGKGLALLGEGKADDAIAPIEEAVRLRQDESAGAERLGESRFALARALWSRAAEHARALELARQARADYGQVEGSAPAVAAIDAWLAAPSARL